MQYGFVKVAAATPNIKVADVVHNTKEICKLITEMEGNQAKVMVFPELSITGYTCGDLFLQETLISGAKHALFEIANHTRDKDGLVFVGLPLCVHGKLMNVLAALNYGRILGFITKTHLPNYNEFYEMRHFEAGPKKATYIEFDGKEIPFGPQILFQADSMSELIVSGEICEDLWAPMQPSVKAATAGATIIVNASASNEVIGKDEYRTNLVLGQSARLVAGYVYSNAGEGESTTDVVFCGGNLIAENGSLLKKSTKFVNETIYGEIDIHRLLNERRRNTTYQEVDEATLLCQKFQLKREETRLMRHFGRTPFVPNDRKELEIRCEEILMLQALGLKKRITHTGSQHVVVGISGGLDSTLALLVMVQAFDMLDIPRRNIYAVTMPCFGTTDRTYQNACNLTRILGATLREIPIANAVNLHFKDINHDPLLQDVTYENAQARERTQVLMDLANQVQGLVIGTGDMSELALGWATYNGDHMSMYGINASIPKTLVKHLVKYSEQTCDNKELKSILADIVETPVSPELLPPSKGEISQKTEDLVGPYELHDFYLYYMLRFGFGPKKIYKLAKEAFENQYQDAILLKWLEVFYRRFFSQQFKRSCLPDGPKVGTVAVSPRGDLRMPSDASVSLWIAEIKELKIT